MATLAKLLQVEMGLPEMAERLAAAGRGKDSILAHINPREAKLLKAHGGSGKKNPRTGIVEFDDYNEDPNAGEAQARQNIESTPLESPKVAPLDTTQSYGNIANAPSGTLRIDPLSDKMGASATGNAPPEIAPSAPAPAASPQQALTAGSAPGSQEAAAVGGGVAPGQLVTEFQPQAQQPGLAQQIGQGAKELGSYLKGINTSLEPAVPYLKSGLGLYQAYQGSQAAKQAQEQAQKTENELRGQAAQYRTQGQQLVQLGQAGGLTAPQQQLLETQRAVAAQRMASSGVTGGTAQAQIEADLSRQAANFAQQNIDQGNKLLQIADADVLKAINTGYAQDQDAQKLARDMYQNVFSNLFGGTGNTGSPGQQKIEDATQEVT